METSYENYTATSQNYDRTRRPAGADQLVAEFAKGPNPIAEQHILDAGCGTGNYLAAVLPHVGAVTGIDINPGMLGQARAKFRGETSARFARGSILEIPFAGARFDSAMMNFVAHHLGDDGQDGRYPNILRAFTEVRRVLAPGGVFSVQSVMHRQFREGYWWAKIIPDAIERGLSRTPDGPVITALLKKAGFESVHTVVPDDNLFKGDAHLDPEGPLKKEWRDGDSTWSLATPEELDAGLARVRELNRTGEMPAFLRAAEQRRRELGLFTFFIARTA